MERVKLKGLQEFVEQLKDCLQDQKLVESQLHIADILLSVKTIELYKKSLTEYEQSLEETIEVKQKTLQEIKKQEGEIRKIQNQEEAATRKAKNKKDELLSMQSTVFNK